MEPALIRLEQLVTDPETPPEAIRQVLVHVSWHILRRLAASPQTPSRILEEILKLRGEDNHWERRDLLRSIVRNPSLAIHVLETLSWHGDASIRDEVAASPRTPVKILERLVFDDSPGVRQALASNSGLPPSLMERLRHDPDDRVRRTVDRERFSKLELTRPDGGRDEDS